MRKLYYISSYDYSKIRVWKLKEGIFKIIQDGEPLSIIHESQSILIIEEIANVFKLIPEDQISLLQASLLKQDKIDIRFENYYEVIIHNNLDIDLLKTSDLEGQHIWLYLNHIIVSEDIKDHLLDVSYDLDETQRILIQEVFSFEKLTNENPTNYGTIWIKP